MNVMNYTRRVESWQAHLSAGTQEEVFDRILKTLCSNPFYAVNSTLSHEGILEALIKREAQRSTAVGEGIAFPHARLEGLSQALVAVVTLDEPVMFAESPVKIICLFLVPASDAAISLKLMAQLSRMLMDSTVRDQILAAKDTESLRNIVKHLNPRIDKAIEARDIMRPPSFGIREDEPVLKCTHTMSVNNLQAIAVVNAENHLVGEITVERLFKYGLPDFFSKLKSVSFIAEFDPFEKYFADERNILARDMMETTARTVPTNYTIMEIVFDLAIKNYSQLYVTDEDGRWIGTIDKGVVLDNVINY
ncbi:MAG: PTS sugar transporter subunit IIA [Pontiellaceae bacterium]|nr:PTS sugar transporter subunit IIA [Pontiellaceae bacterium]